MTHPMQSMLGPRALYSSVWLTWLVVGLSGGCIPRAAPQSGEQSAAATPGQTSPSTTPGPAASPPAPAPPAPPAAPVPPVKNTGNVNTDRFLELWTDIHKLSNGYFSP